MSELRVNQLLSDADEMLDNKFHIGGYCLFLNTGDVQDILAKIKAVLPEEIKTAETIIKRRDDIYSEAQNRAERIVNEAQNTAANILSESELIRAVREKAAKIQEQVKQNCEDMKNQAVEEAENVRKAAYKEAMEIREGAQAYAEEVLTNLERDIEQVHRIVRNGQDYLSQQRNRPKNPIQREVNNAQ